MIDICTVVFREEIDILRVQAESLALNATELGTRNIYVVINDDETMVAEISPDWWGPLADKVLVVPRSAFSAPWVQDGWVSQQMFKILTASMSYNVWTMVLDAKTILVQKLALENILDPQGRARSGTMPLYPVFEPSRRITQDLFHVELTQQIGPGGVPFLLHNDTVRLMISDVALLTKTNFPAWFQQQACVTEFILYSGYVHHRLGSFDALYASESALHPVNICHSEVADFDRKLQAMRAPDVSTVSIHRRAWQQLDLEQQHRFRSLLIDHSIMSAWDM
jgi:hypothetical protein